VPRAASIGQQGNLAKSGVAAPTPGFDKGISEPDFWWGIFQRIAKTATFTPVKASAA
jgi:hypothetical protein